MRSIFLFTVVPGIEEQCDFYTLTSSDRSVFEMFFEKSNGLSRSPFENVEKQKHILQFLRQHLFPLFSFYSKKIA